MNAIPAKVAGVERLVVTTPTPNGEVNDLVLAAAHIAGVDEIYRVGGAQAVAALAYGTDRIKRVDVVTGPGNAWVAEAKRQLYGVVGIDMVAGPSEILVIADKDNKPEWLAADLLSQAEHDPTSQSILITDDRGLASQVMDAIDIEFLNLPTAKTARTSWDDHGLVVLVDSLDEAPALSDRLAAEHRARVERRALGEAPPQLALRVVVPLAQLGRAPGVHGRHVFLGVGGERGHARLCSVVCCV